MDIKKAGDLFQGMLEKAKDVAGVGGHAQLVLPRDDGGWEVRARGASEATDTFSEKADAVQKATELAQKQGAGLVIFTSTGDIDKTRDYS